MALPEESTEDRDGANHSSDAASSSGVAASATRRLPSSKMAAQARAQSQPYALGDERKNVRPTDLLSCSECRKRKTKCDRQTPCSGCIQRGKPNLCNPDIRRYPPAAAKLSDDIATLRNQVRELQNFLASKFQDYMPTVQTSNNGAATASDGISDQVVVSAPSNAMHAHSQTHSGQPVLSGSDPGNLILSTSSMMHPDENNSLVQVQAEMQTERNDQSMASILARFRDSEILGADKEETNSETSPTSFSLQLPLHSDSTACPTIRCQVRTTASMTRMQLFMPGLLAEIPSPEYCQQAVTAYFKQTAWEIFVVCRKQFLSEFSEFELLRARGEASDVDPAWLALLFIVMSMGLLMTYHNEGNSSMLPEITDDLRSSSALYAEISKTALDLADWTSAPSVRVLQTVLITGWRYHHVDARSNSFDGQGRSCLAYKSLLHVAYEQCCALNIDKFQSDPNATFTNDPSLPNSAPSMRRQLALRLWFSYLVVETLLSDHQFHRKGPLVEYVLPGLFTDDDLLSAYDRPERSVTDCSSLLDLHLQVVIFAQLWRQTRLATEGASLAEITPTIELYRSQLENIVMNLASMKYVEVPPPFGSYRGLINAIRLFQASAAIRVYRPALLSTTCTQDPLLVKNATAEATAILMVSTLPEAKQLMLCFPPAVSFLYNAATLLLVTLCPEADEATAASRSLLLQGTFRLLHSVETESRSVAIASNARKISDALFGLGRALLQEGHGLTYIARQRLEAVLSVGQSNWSSVSVSQSLANPPSNPYDFSFPSATMWGAPLSTDQTTLGPAVWPDAFTTDPMGMSTDIDGWLKWLDAV